MRRKTPEEVIGFGLYLRSQKDILPHGAFIPFVEKELGCHRTTANRYMREAKRAIQAVKDAKRAGSSPDNK